MWILWQEIQFSLSWPYFNIFFIDLCNGSEHLERCLIVNWKHYYIKKMQMHLLHCHVARNRFKTGWEQLESLISSYKGVLKWLLILIFRENRLTHVIIFVMIGLSVIMTPILRKIPMPVLFGVFLYMGIAALKGIQFFDRILIMFMPNKYQPDYAFLRQVSLHLN